MKLFLITLTFLFSSFAFAVDCSKHPIYCHIKRVAPWIKKDKAMKYSNMFYKLSKKYDTNPHHSVAIARQETTFGRSGDRKESIIVFNEDMTSWKRYRGYSDICLFQFHADTIVNLKLDPIRLKKDINYCFEEHFKLLKKKIRTCEKTLKIGREESWACWHSYTKSKRKIYKGLVQGYL